MAATTVLSLSAAAAVLAPCKAALSLPYNKWRTPEAQPFLYNCGREGAQRTRDAKVRRSPLGGCIEMPDQRQVRSDPDTAHTARRWFVCFLAVLSPS